MQFVTGKHQPVGHNAQHISQNNLSPLIHRTGPTSIHDGALCINNVPQNNSVYNWIDHAYTTHG